MISMLKESISMLEEYKAANMVEAAPKQQIILPSVVWQPPPMSMLKINWDAAVGKNCRRIGLGVIARDCNGRVIAARSITRMIEVDSAMAESIAAVQGLILGKELSSKGLIFEGDAKQIVHEVNSRQPCNSRYGHFVEDIQEGMAGLYDSCFNFIPRDGNHAAHGLAKEAIKHVVDITWRNEIPLCIYDIIKREETTPSL